MANQQLAAEKRTDFRKSANKALRREGYVPATVYGRQMESSISVKVCLDDLRQCLHAAGINTIVDLTIKGEDGEQKMPAMLRALQRDAVSRRILSVDLHAISMDEKITAVVDVHVTGEAIGTKSGGLVDHVRRELTVKALPGNVPSHIDLDVSGLDVGDAITIGDIKLDGVEVEGHPGDPVVLVRVPHVVEVPEAEAAEGEAAAPEAAEGEAAAE